MNRLEESYKGEFNFVRIDVTKPNGEKLAREHGIVGQPNYVFFDSANQETRRMSGSQPLDVMAAQVERTLEE